MSTVCTGHSRQPDVPRRVRRDNRGALEWPTKQRSSELAPLSWPRRDRSLLGISSLSLRRARLYPARKKPRASSQNNTVSRNGARETVPRAHKPRQAARVTRREPRVASGCDPCRPSGGSCIVICHSARKCASCRAATAVGADTSQNKGLDASSLLLSLPNGDPSHDAGVGVCHLSGTGGRCLLFPRLSLRQRYR